MAQFSVKIMRLNGSVLGEKQHRAAEISGGTDLTMEDAFIALIEETDRKREAA